MSNRTRRSVGTWGRAGVALAAVSCAGTLWATTPRFFPDDPLTQFPETQDASAVQDRPISQGYDFVDQSLLGRGDRSNRRSLNVNTIDEVPDSGWFTNRIGAHLMSLEELRRGPDQSPGPEAGFRITRGKAAGVSPGFQMRDARGDRYFVKLDPPRFPELSSAAEVIATKILHAAGYFVPENYIVTVTRDQLDIEGATVTGRNQRRRPMTEEDLDFILSRAARRPDGSYRLLASKAVAGRPVGPFRYYGTRPDDPNDIVPHEHRRELRGLRVFAAWLNNADSRGINSLDTVVEVDGRSVVRHHLLDFGSALGAAAIDQKSRRSGNERLFDPRQMVLRIATLGLVVPDWARVPFPEYPGVGRFEAAHFDPERWVPHYPNPAFDNARADDLFWAARRVMAFSADAIRAIVQTGQLSDPASERYLADTLIARRDAIGRAWLTPINPITDFTLDREGVVRFSNIAADLGLAPPAAEHRARWGTYHNATDSVTSVAPETVASEPRLRVPDVLLNSDAQFIKASISTVHDAYPGWLRPVDVYFKRTESGWSTVGVWRVPDDEGPEE